MCKTDLIGRQLTAIDDIYLEYAEPSAHQQLADNTAFDAYVMCWQGERRVSLCIEVKFTEGPYSWGETERRRMFDESDPYIRLSESSSLFRAQAFKSLRNRHLKQIWRNFLLGTLTAKSLDGDFIYLHLYPKGNLYQAAVCADFSDYLTEKGLCAFSPTTYQDFTTAAKFHLNKILSPWIQYIEQRYNVAPERLS